MQKTSIKHFLYTFLILVLASLPLMINAKNRMNRDFDKIDLDGYNKLMIVAHPDDEMLWGGSHLIDDNYLVVCITCGVDNQRVKEFEHVMKATNDKYIMLGYPDKTNGERDDWSKVKADIMSDLDKILSLKDWELIVTHNPFGEYGHIHHKMTNQMITYELEDKSKLMYFGTYYSKKNIGKVVDTMPCISEKNMKEKVRILKMYKTQIFIMTAFDQMMEHENWVSYDDWQAGVR